MRTLRPIRFSATDYLLLVPQRTMMVAAWQTLSEFVRWLSDAPANTTLLAKDVHEILVTLAGSGPALEPLVNSLSQEPTWPERLWTAPAETRLGVIELAQALGRSKSWVYRHTSAKSKVAKLPHRKFDGELVFVIGEVREWIRQEEERVVLPLSKRPGHTR